MPRLRLPRWRTLSCSIALLVMSCLPRVHVLSLPPPTSIPTNIPPELRIGKVDVDVDNDWVRLTPEQAAKLASQIKHLQELATKSYLLGRSEGAVVLGAQRELFDAEYRHQRKRLLYGILGAFLVGLGAGAIAGANNE